jgi:Tat protein translocase TatB subunit
MFGIGIGELAVVLGVALIVVGPEDLPKIARWLAKALKMARNSVKQLMDTINMDEDLREVKEAGKVLQETVHDLNPMSAITDEINAVKKETKEIIKPIEDLSKTKIDLK